MLARTRTFAMAAVVVLCAGGALACSENTALTVTGVEPESGPYMGGERVVIEGSGFGTQGFSVYFGGRKAGKCSRQAAARLMCETPAGDAGKAVDVKVVFDDAREATLKGAYTFVDTRGMGFTDDKSASPPATPPK